MLAAPARRTPIVLTLADGTQVTAIKCGDEGCHWYETLDHRIITPSESGLQILNSEESKAERELKGQRLLLSQQSRTSNKTNAYPTKGEVRSLVILANFADVSFKSATAREDFQRMLMQDHYSDNGATGSAHDFYIEASMGQFDPQFDVIGPVTLSQGYAYYGGNGANGNDLHSTDMVVEACQIADAEVDFSQYDYDNDGFIDNVFVFYAGHGEATVEDENTVWPHSAEVTKVYGTPVILDGKQLNHYACSNELTREGTMDGIGTFVHEYGHVLGLPDLYATNYSGAFTPGEWSVMDQGEYNNYSRTPPTFSAYERYALGWLKPMFIDEPSSLCIKTIQSNDAYMMKTRNTNEYYIIENRQQEGWDAYLPGHGMLVWHIDYDDYAWRNNFVNINTLHQRVDIIEADGVQSKETRDGDAFPGSAGVTSLTSESAATLSFAITNITETDGIITADVDGGGSLITPFTQTVPTALAASDITASSFVANWEEVDDAESYTLLLGHMAISERQHDVATFDGGVTGLMDSWFTTATSTYNTSAYAGESMPSLRMMENSENVLCSHDAIYGVTLWYKGSSAADDNRLRVSMLDANNEWHTMALVNIKTHELTESMEGVTIDVSGTGRKLTIPSVANAADVYKTMSITFEKGEGSRGSLALDDVDVEFADMMFVSDMAIEGITGTHHLFEDLQNGHSYSYVVTAQNGDQTTKRSNIVDVTTLEDEDGIAEVVTDHNMHDTYYYNMSGQKVSLHYRGIIIRPDGKKSLIIR